MRKTGLLAVFIIICLIWANKAQACEICQGLYDFGLSRSQTISLAEIGKSEFGAGREFTKQFYRDIKNGKPVTYRHPQFDFIIDNNGIRRDASYIGDMPMISGREIIWNCGNKTALIFIPDNRTFLAGINKMKRAQTQFARSAKGSAYVVNYSRSNGSASGRTQQDNYRVNYSGNYQSGTPGQNPTIITPNYDGGPKTGNTYVVESVENDPPPKTPKGGRK